MSPIPSPHPQRSSPNARRHEAGSLTGSSKLTAGRQRKAGTESSTSLVGLWGTSLSALQGLAQEFLGTELTGSDAQGTVRTRKSFGSIYTARTSSSVPPPSQWGPPVPTSSSRSTGIGTGTTEEQTAAFRAQKRKDMLIGQESSYADTLGKFKRRLSDDRAAASAPPGDGEDRDARVYIHQVKKADTLAGITIRYNISANALRKANRMWPNDTVQIRKTLILPVDACGVKGKPLTAAEIDALGSESEALSTMLAEEVPTPTAANPVPIPKGRGHNRNRTNSTSTHTSVSGAGSSAEGEPTWQHDSWVMLPGSTEPTEIARLPRRALGYFPPARRKSNSYSDLDTPSTSLELSRSTTADVLGSMPLASPNGRASSRRPHRRPSNATNGYFPSYLTGPGGVGTMDRNVRCPGPAQDGLNKLMAKHLPDVAPPRNQHSLYQPDLPMYSDAATPSTSGAATPAYPHGPSGGNNLHLENVGGAIESWVRRIAKTVQTPTDRSQAARESVGNSGKGAGGIGDLIEMTDEFEIGGDEDEEDHRGRPGTSNLKPGSTATSYFDGAMSRERRRNASKGGKHD